MPVRFGKIVAVKREPGLGMVAPFFTSLSRYPLYRQHITIDADKANLRTSDLNLVQGGIVVVLRLMETRPALKISTPIFVVSKAI